MTESTQVVEEHTFESLVASGYRTDLSLPSFWISIPVANYAIWAIVALIPAIYASTDLSQLTVPLAIFEMAGFLLSAFTAYLVYMLVNRRNTHLAREQAMLNLTLDSAKSKASPGDLKTLLPLNSAERNFAQLVQASGERSAILWALLTFLPYVGWLFLIWVVSFLSSDLKKHELREENVLQDLDRSYRVSSSNALPVRERRAPYRSAAVYAAVSLFFMAITTVGLVLSLIAFLASIAPTQALQTSPLSTTLEFLIVGMVGLGMILNYWLYLAIGDPTAHFQYHQSLEPVLKEQSEDVPRPGATIR